MHLLRNGNTAFDLRKHAKCGAKKRKGGECKQPAMRNGKCRLHGGLSTGPKTEDGKLFAGLANYKHGGYTKEFLEERKEIRGEIKDLKKWFKEDMKVNKELWKY